MHKEHRAGMVDQEHTHLLQQDTVYDPVVYIVKLLLVFSCPIFILPSAVPNTSSVGCSEGHVMQVTG